MSTRSDAEQALAWQLTAAGLLFTEEARLVPGRQWRWDFAFHEARLAVEVQGGIWSHGAHSRPWGVMRDLEKHNALVLAGWRDLFVTPQMVEDGTALELIERALGAEATREPPCPPSEPCPFCGSTRAVQTVDGLYLCLDCQRTYEPD